MKEHTIRDTCVCKEELLELIVTSHFTDVNADISENIGLDASIEPFEAFIFPYVRVDCIRRWHFLACA